MPSPQNPIENSRESVNKPLLRELITKHFDLEEIKMLCFELNLDYEDLTGDNKAGKTMSLVLYFNRRNNLFDLIQKLRKERPRVDWDAVERPPESAAPFMSKANKAVAIGKLKELSHLLKESTATYLTQTGQRNRLFTTLHRNHVLPDYKGFNNLFYKLYDDMTKEEKDLFLIIRGTTERSIFQYNEKLQSWLENNSLYQFLPESTPLVAKPEEDLLQLKIHFNSWFPKYYNVFLNDRKESLVYLDDEYRLGIGFPKTLQQSVNDVIGELEAQ
jgi:hypothetical protein